MHKSARETAARVGIYEEYEDLKTEDWRGAKARILFLIPM